MVSERNYKTTKFSTENVLAIEMKKKNRDTFKYTCLFRTFNARIKKILKYELWYDVKPKYGELC